MRIFFVKRRPGDRVVCRQRWDLHPSPIGAGAESVRVQKFLLTFFLRVDILNAIGTAVTGWRRIHPAPIFFMHLLYVDESGDDGFSQRQKYLGLANQSNVFLRTGLALHDHKWRKINEAVNNMRYKYKIPPSVEIHATEIRRGTKRIQKNGQKSLVSNWYGENFPETSDRLEIIRDFCQLIAEMESITLICVVVEKQKIIQPQLVGLHINEINGNRTTEKCRRRAIHPNLDKLTWQHLWKRILVSQLYQHIPLMNPFHSLHLQVKYILLHKTKPL